MLNRYARAFFTRVLTPVARTLLRAGIGPDVVTFIGTLGVCAGALAFYPRGSFLVGTLVITAFVFPDLIDGTMARLSERSSRWGAFLDSTLDRLGDAAIFGSLAWWFARPGDDALLAVLCLVCLVVGAVVSYAKARAEGLGMTANVGVAERADRLVVVLVVTGLDGLGVPFVQAAGLWALAIASTATLVQRMAVVRRQALGS
jgi:CDP-diacylglycerol--glycerol-3-phosphate 3-phosphatidyltransferase